MLGFNAKLFRKPIVSIKSNNQKMWERKIVDILIVHVLVDRLYMVNSFGKRLITGIEKEEEAKKKKEKRKKQINDVYFNDDIVRLDVFLWLYISIVHSVSQFGTFLIGRFERFNCSFQIKSNATLQFFDLCNKMKWNNKESSFKSTQT